MRKSLRKNRKKISTGKIIAGILLGSVVGATVGWLTSPVTGLEPRNRLWGNVSARERLKKAEDNVEGQVRELIEESGHQV